jgi:anti-sigma factor RsiW
MIPAPLGAGGCEDLEERISELLDGELDPATAARVALHLAACAACARLAAELDATVRALHALGRRVPPAPR